MNLKLGHVNYIRDVCVWFWDLILSSLSAIFILVTSKYCFNQIGLFQKKIAFWSSANYRGFSFSISKSFSEYHCLMIPFLHHIRFWLLRLQKTSNPNCISMWNSKVSMLLIIWKYEDCLQDKLFVFCKYIFFSKGLVNCRMHILLAS